MKSREIEHEKVFGDSFCKYNKDEMKPLIGNLEKRFTINKIDPTSIFKNSNCLDAGCGGGPASLFMAKYGAKKINSIDISEQNVETTLSNAKKFEFNNIHAELGSIENLEFEDEFFDVVWCYGVVHHTANPDKCLTELARVLKVGGTLILFLYGTGGILWYTIHKARLFTKNIDVDVCRSLLELCGTDLNLMISIMDNWKVPYLRVYRDSEVSKRLKELGFEDNKPMPLGLPWDTNHRKNIYKEDIPWMGEGDLRYVLKKVNKPSREKSSICLHTDEVCPDSKYDRDILKRYDDYFQELHELSEQNRVAGLAAYREIFLTVAELLRNNAPFNNDLLEKRLKELIKLLNNINKNI